MRAAVMRERRLVVDTLPDPEPGPGEALVRTLACGICGSDLHMLEHAEALMEDARAAGSGAWMDPARDVVMGHEFCAEVVDYGPGSARRLPAGTRVCAMPVLPREARICTVGYSNEAPGGFGELMLLSEALLLPVPNGLATEHAALVEPMAVGHHAVARVAPGPKELPLVIGCGPVGLAVIASLRLRGCRPIVAADFSLARRRLASELGADVVVDPARESPYRSWRALAEGEAGAGADPIAALLGQPTRPAVVFECVGVPGVIDQILRGAPRGARIVVVGVCLEEDRFRPSLGIHKELSLHFALGYTPAEFAATLRHLAEGEIAVEPLITGQVGLEGVAPSFAALASPEHHVKILVEPWRSGAP
jgi:threonine dehydrogenase-like Zn-dependent dehydrogenase